MKKSTKDTIISGCLVIVGISALCILVYSFIMMPPSEQERLRYIELQRRCKQPGTLVETKDGLRGRVVRKCWVGGYRYEVRLADGSITYINAADFLR